MVWTPRQSLEALRQLYGVRELANTVCVTKHRGEPFKPPLCPSSLQTIFLNKPHSCASTPSDSVDRATPSMADEGVSRSSTSSDYLSTSWDISHSEIRTFLANFYKVSDQPDSDELWISHFTDDAEVTIGNLVARGHEGT